MTRVKETSDYIKELCLSNTVEKQTLGDLLKAQYAEWTGTLDLRHFLAFTETIQKNKTQIGVAQYFGKFRAYAFEEYLHRLLQTKVQIPQPFQLFWGQKCLVWKKGGKEYAMEFDVSIGKRTDQFIEPAMVFETKVELESARLKAALASFIIQKKKNQTVKCLSSLHK